MAKGILLFFTILLFILPEVQSQFGTSTFGFMEQSVAPRTVALGGATPSIQDNDLSLGILNPSLINENYHNQLLFSFSNNFAGARSGITGYAYHTKKLGTLSIGMQFMNWGEFTWTDELNILGTFKASETAILIGRSWKVNDQFQAGIILKPIFSSLETYQSFALASDLGMSMTSPDNLSTTSILIRNLGFQVTPYYEDGSREELPLNIQFGISRKLQYAPFRLLATIHHLETWDLTYDSPIASNSLQLNQEENPEKPGFFQTLPDKALRHMVIGVEILPFSNFYLRLGYNYKIRQELKDPLYPAMTGFSWGLGFKIKRLKFAYGKSIMETQQTLNYFSVSTNFSDFFHKDLL